MNRNSTSLKKMQFDESLFVNDTVNFNSTLSENLNLFISFSFEIRCEPIASHLNNFPKMAGSSNFYSNLLWYNSSPKRLKNVWTINITVHCGTGIFFGSLIPSVRCYRLLNVLQFSQGPNFDVELLSSVGCSALAELESLDKE